MCERESNDDIFRGNELSRRQFGALGLSASLAAMLPSIAFGKRLTESGYAVLTVNPFYRSIKGAPASREDGFTYARTLSATTHVPDAKAFVG